jgi:hypothetical protein
MKDHNWAIIIVFSVLAMLFTPRLWAATDWHPTTTIRDVVVRMHWTFQDPVPCGKHKNALACATIPRRGDVLRPGRVCVITHPGFSSKPSTQDSIVLGRLLDGCLTAAGGTKMVMGEKVITSANTMLISFKQGEPNFQATDRYFKAVSCGISVVPRMGDDLDEETAYRWGHELTHCWRGSYHD